MAMTTRLNADRTDRDETVRAFDSALRALARRDHSIAELERKLRERNISETAAAAVVARLVESGYLDDRRFAERWADAAVRNGRGYGVRLRQDLARRGVNREIIEEVLAGITTTYGEDAALAALAERRFAGFVPGAATDREKHRVVAYLQRRGFPLAAIFRYFRILDDNSNFCD
jgi:regulatory protein